MELDPDDYDEDWSEAEDRAWCASEHARVLGYLQDEGVVHGGVGDWPAWHIGPHVAVWSVGSLAAPGQTGWWAISGDMPCDYCSSDDCPDPRSAVRRIAGSWLANLALTQPDDDVIHDCENLPSSLAPLLQSRAEILLEWVEDVSAWESLN